MLCSMKKQNQIKRTLSQPNNIACIKELLDDKDIKNRTQLAKQVCKHFEFYDHRGQMQIASCMNALRKLESAGNFKLPKAQINPGKRSPVCLDVSVPKAVNVPEEVNQIKSLELVQIGKQDTELRKIWNSLMLSEHYLHAATMVGRQLCYLIRSEHGWLGGLGFASSARQLSARDQWIGWSQEEREAQLDQIICMSRFLIRPDIHCKNLASKVLGMSMATIAQDFEKKYAYRPLLVESFVDTEHFSGTCYKATNWIFVGETRGRGRQDRYNKAALSKKAIYLYPLVANFKDQLDIAPDPNSFPPSPLGISEGLETEHWSEQEFGGALLGNTRLSERLVNIAHAKAQHPGKSISVATGGNAAEVKGYYRMIDKPDDSAVNMENILQPHRERTIQRMAGQQTVLCLQDGSELNYTNLDKCTGLGDLKANQTGAKTKGLVLHSSFAITSDGIPLGVVKAQCIAPQARSPDDKRKASKIPIEEKKTFVWIEHHRDLVEIAETLPETQLIHVCDREADFFELFDEQRKNPKVDLLIRAKHDRNIPEAPFKLFEAVREAPEKIKVSVSIPRKSARRKKSKQKAKAARSARKTELILRCIKLKLPAPSYYPDKEPIDIQLIHAIEENPPQGEKPIEWFLLTTLKIKSPEDIVNCLRWYTRRWRIEDYHRVLKSGCKIGDIAHETAERQRRAIAINLVIAWRIMLMTLLGRETPELPAELLFSDIELKVLHAYAKKTNYPSHHHSVKQYTSSPN